MPWIATVLGALAACCFYLAAPQQRLRASPLAHGWRYVSVALAVLASALWIASLDTMAGAFSALNAVMTGAVLVPYLVWMVRPAAARGHR